MNYSAIKTYDVANGPGVRVSLFVSGCRRHCKGCFQPETWDFDYGSPFTEDTTGEIISALQPSFIQGLTILGGEPFELENQAELVKLLKKVQAILPSKDIWIYTGFSYEEICDTELIKLTDALVDGSFIESQRDIILKFRGSRNQRILYLVDGHVVAEV